ncbi:hypothetical protein TREMEDRAFT_26114 [Tremella mesenterica DSM 1558]|uniref:uncharacterized protein n=1 Tax=Tremella mesenterica (strain ATCC 24925 / CBS 8224 / DSM 1558 / NBRC 9311 / NRRL Y-6157 / RJB 2259-6 / UBC 559-6) TaxID=578456 RepID=UPI0003F496E2|nr:uncharacterized protein TREMEDRAFT_26114 [Tremella mesenterica DSM 1558]EIW72900.1 hypothetical protein TREMEDRAFT_26114 [Tremella mesenterica DSM 1558]
MRIHQLLDLCLDYIALDGVLGSDPHLLQQHLISLNPSIDDDFFTFVWRQLCQHPSIQIIVASYPVPRPDGTIITERAEKDKLKKKKLKSGTTADVVRFLKEVDNVEEPVLNRSDLPGLLTKWGTRLRVRCVDDEIYSRLTGLPHKISKITPVVFHILQITAKCREKGITAIELGPLVGASQGSMFHYMKTLVNLKLCVKIPSLIHGSVTSLLIYRSFVHQSDAYLNYERQRKALEEIGPITGGVTKDSTTDTSADTAHATSKFGGFPPLTEAEVATGHVVQERLLKLLDHPSLENHLLRMVNLLELIGWRGAYQVRQRRAVLRHVQRLIDKGVVEKVVVGNQNARCLRLCKFNLEGAPAPEARQQLDETDEMEMDDQGSSIEHDTPPDPRTYLYHVTVLRLNL